MGGNAIIVDGKPITSRLPKSYVNKVAEHVIPIFQEHIGKCMIPRHVNKPDHGDLDIIYFEKQPDTLIQFIQQRFSPTKIVDGFANRVISFDIDCQQFGLENTRFQIDLIRCNRTSPINADIYFSYGKLGMVLGMIFKFYDITYADAGIYFEYKKTKIVICENLKTVFNFFNLDYSAWENFENPEYKDIFEWISKSNLMTRRLIRRLTSDVKRATNENDFYFQFITFLSEKFSKEIESGIEFNETNILENTCKHFNVFDKVNTLLHEKENDKKNIDSRKIIQNFKKIHNREPNRTEMAECCRLFINTTNEEGLICFINKLANIN
jgi:hypothetical protein